MSVLHQPVYTPTQRRARDDHVERRAKLVGARPLLVIFDEVSLTPKVEPAAPPTEAKPKRIADLKCACCTPTPVVEGLPAPDDVLSSVAHYYRKSRRDLRSRHRFPFLIEPRHVAMYLMRELCLNEGPRYGGKRFFKMTFLAIAELFSGRHHTSVITAVEKVAGLVATDQRMAGVVNSIRAAIERGRAA